MSQTTLRCNKCQMEFPERFFRPPLGAPDNGYELSMVCQLCQFGREWYDLMRSAEIEEELERWREHERLFNAPPVTREEIEKKVDYGIGIRLAMFGRPFAPLGQQERERFWAAHHGPEQLDLFD